MRFAFVGSPTPGFVAREGTAIGLYGAVEGRLWLAATGPLYASVSVSLGGPLRGARVMGPGVTVHEIGGLLVGTSVHLGATW
jgi:hypothetical protein